MAKKDEITTLTCKTCKTEVSGPNEKSVKDTMARHEASHTARKK